MKQMKTRTTTTTKVARVHLYIRDSYGVAQTTIIVLFYLTTAAYENQRPCSEKTKVCKGGFGYVFVAQDISTGKEYALKRLLAGDNDASKSILREIKFLTKLSGHPNIIHFYAAASIEKEHSEHGKAEYLLLTELCTGQWKLFLPFVYKYQMFYI
ncbi:cyclin-G-associated kinase [Trichonephila clavipes]|uniref:Cyclin-G-associated kinase n=1 Tax=Trichonephila clavipes TaxID=2585209 RepID=A0A8X6RX88_TRICX|nr:cyclin-G-associated kinase [Trichonephila clavipes]